MKILHINYNYMNTALHQTFVEHLDKVNVQSSIFAPTYSENKIVIEPNSNVLCSFCISKKNRFSFFLKERKIMNSLEYNFRNVEDYDIIHAHTLFTDGYCAMKMSQKYQKPYVVAVRDTDLNSFYKYRFYLKKIGLQILLNASKIVFLSDSYLNCLLNKYVPKKYSSVVLKKAVVIPNGINDFWYKNLMHDEIIKRRRIENCKKKKINFLFVGRICKRKNPTLTLAAVKELSKLGYEVTFTLVGEIIDEKIYKKLVLNPTVKYFHQMEKDKLIEIYKQADMFIMPSKTETFGLTYVEALTQGLPVIYTRNQGFDKQFNEGVVGFHVNNSVNDIVEKILKICDCYELIAENCIPCSKKFMWDKIVLEYKRIYDEIL